MSVSVKQASTEEKVPKTDCSEQFRTWVQSQEGKHLWNEKQITISIERLCHALEQARADIYGLLIFQEGTIILSSFKGDAFARLESRYRAAAVAGLCFWWEDSILTHIQDEEDFLTRMHRLPSLPESVLVRVTKEGQEPNLQTGWACRSST